MTLFTLAQQAVHRNILTISSGIGIFGVFLMLVMFIFRPHIFYNPAGKIIASIALFNLIDSVAKMFGRNALENSSVSFGCNLQAFIIQHISHSIWLLELVLALYLVLIIILEQRIRDIKSMESTAISLAIILPLPLSIYMLVGIPDGKLPLVGDADFWCWIDNSYPKYQLWMGMIPLWTIILLLLIAILSIYVSLKQYKKEPLLRDSQPIRNYLIMRLITSLLAFLTIWAPTAINISTNIIGGKANNFILACIQLSTSPSQGMLNFIVFYLTYYYSPNLNDIPPIYKEEVKIQEDQKDQGSDDEIELDPYDPEEGSMFDALEAGKISQEDYRKILDSIKFDNVTQFNTRMNASGAQQPTVVQMV